MSRGFTYVSAIVAINLAQFGYIWVMVFLMKQPLLAQGGPLFITYTFFDFIVFIGCYLLILSHGAIANEIDLNFKVVII